MANIKDTLKTAGALAVTGLGTLVGMELAFLGSSMVVSDVNHVKAGVKELKNPTPIKMKKRGKLFAKAEVNQINPFTGKITAYTGTRKPANKRAYRY